MQTEGEWKQGQWIQTFTGKKFFPLNPKIEDIDIEDIAHALSMKCRFCGQCKEFYSVAEHSVRVSRICPMEDMLWGLLHDASEAYLPDICRPIKGSIFVGCPWNQQTFRETEKAIMSCVSRKFSLPLHEPESVKIADVVLLRTEARDLMPDPPEPWNLSGEILPAKIRPMSQAKAKVKFLERFDHLHGAVE